MDSNEISPHTLEKKVVGLSMAHMSEAQIKELLELLAKLGFTEYSWYNGWQMFQLAAKREVSTLISR